MKLLGSGGTADVYLDDNNKLIKLFKDHISKESVQKEAQNQKAVYEAGMPVPEIFDIKKIDGRYAIIMEYFHGQSLGKKFLHVTNYINGIDTTKNLPEEMNKIIFALSISVELQIFVNSKKLEGLPLMKDNLTKNIIQVEDINKNQKKMILDKMDTIDFKNYLCHGDFHPFNLIETNDGIKIIDWADATTGNAEADIYRTYMIYKLNKAEIAEKYLEMYCDSTSVKKEDVLKYEPIIMTARLSENIMLREREEIKRSLMGYFKRASG